MRQQVPLKTNTWRTLLESVPSQFQKHRRRKRGHTERGCSRTSQGSNHRAVMVPVLVCLISALSRSCCDEQWKSNAIMPNSIENNNLFFFPLFCLNHEF